MYYLIKIASSPEHELIDNKNQNNKPCWNSMTEQLSELITWIWFTISKHLLLVTLVWGFKADVHDTLNITCITKVYNKMWILSPPYIMSAVFIQFMHFTQHDFKSKIKQNTLFIECLLNICFKIYHHFWHFEVNKS